MAYFCADVDENICKVLQALGYVEHTIDGLGCHKYLTTDKGDALLKRLLNNTRL